MSNDGWPLAPRSALAAPEPIPSATTTARVARCMVDPTHRSGRRSSVLPVCQGNPDNLTSWHESPPWQAKHHCSYEHLHGIWHGIGLVNRPDGMWNQPAQSPFRRYASAQVEG